MDEDVATAVAASSFRPERPRKSGMKSFREHREQLAEFGRRVAEEQGVDVDIIDADFVAFGAACRQALAKGRNVPVLAVFEAEQSKNADKIARKAVEDDIEPLAVGRRRRNVDVATGSVVESLRSELLECRQRMSHYARQTTELELRLEQIDREHQRTYRRSLELTESIEMEEAEDLRREAIAIAQLRTPRPGQRHEQILAVMARHPDEDVTPAALSASLGIKITWTHMLLRQLVDRGLVRRVGYGRYRAAKEG